MRGLYFRDGEREVDVCASVHEHPDQLLPDVAAGFIFIVDFPHTST